MVYARRQQAIAEELRRRRKSLGIPLTAVARSANVAYSYLSAFDNGRGVNVSFAFLAAYAEAVGMEVCLKEVKS